VQNLAMFPEYCTLLISTIEYLAMMSYSLL
jgi:hypothetical protein